MPRRLEALRGFFLFQQLATNWTISLPHINKISLVGRARRLNRELSEIVQIRDGLQPHSGRMKKRELTLKQVSSVPCPTCGAAAGKRCELHSGAPRSGPHVDRKLSAAAAIEAKRISRGTGRR
jgi:hypothetical protein